MTIPNIISIFCLTFVQISSGDFFRSRNCKPVAVDFVSLGKRSDAVSINRLKKSYRHEYRPAQPVQMVQYSQQAPVQPTGTLKSLKDAPKDESLSIRSARYRSKFSLKRLLLKHPQNSSPSDSFYREGSPRFTNSYLRPKPPPYKPTGTSGSNNSTMQRKGPVGGVEI